MLSDKERITFVVSALTPTLGLERVTLRLLEALDADFEVHVICIGGSAADARLHANLEVLGSPVTGLRRLKSFNRLYKRSRRGDLGIVVLVGVWTAVPWLLVAPKDGGRTVVWEHTLLREKLALSRPLQFLKLMSRWLYRRADSVVSVSSPVTDDLAEYRSIRQLRTIPNLVDTPSLEEIEAAVHSRSPDPYKILCVGSLTPIKAQHLAIEAMTWLEDPYSLTIVGAGPRMQSLKAQSASLGLEHRVHFTGHLGKDEVREELRKAALLLHCSVAETFGLVYVEAADMGTPVVSVDTRIAQQMIPHYAPGCTSRRDAESIASTIRRVCTSAKISPEQYVEAAKRRADDFGVDQVRRAWIEVVSGANQSSAEIPRGRTRGTA